MVPETANAVDCDCATGNYQPPSCQPKTCGSKTDVGPAHSTVTPANIIIDGESPDALYYQDEKAACTVTCERGYSTTGTYETVAGTRDKYQQAYTCHADKTFTPQPIPLVCNRESS
jgi:hypothetical protein